MPHDHLIARAREVIDPRRLSPDVTVGSVGSALETAAGHVFVGVCIDTACSMGFCAEHNAIGSMITAGESRIAVIVAVHSSGRVLSPCGRCREFISQVDPGNKDTLVIVDGGRVVTLASLLPERWNEPAG